jgi:hypothetical protein
MTLVDLAIFLVYWEIVKWLIRPLNSRKYRQPSSLNVEFEDADVQNNTIIFSFIKV